MIRPLTLVALACGAALLAGHATGTTRALFTASKTIDGSTVVVDKLSNYFAVTPGSSTRPGTSTPIASGDVDALALDFGTVPSAQAFSNVFAVRNVSSAPQTARLTLDGVPQVASAAFATSGASTATLAPGASSAVVVTTSGALAGRSTGTLQLSLDGSSWLYRKYSLAILELPQAPASLTAIAKQHGRISLAWAGSATQNVSTYSVYRSSGGGQATRVASGLGGTSYDDDSTADGTTYTYTVRALTSDATPLESLDSSAAVASADASAPSTPVSVSLAGGSWINQASNGRASVVVALSGSSSSDTVSATISAGGQSASGTSAGGGTVTIGPLDVGSLPDGQLTLSAHVTDAAGNVSGDTTGSAKKDTRAPSAPSASYVDNKNKAPDEIVGTAEAGATVRATSDDGFAYSDTASSSGAFDISVAPSKHDVVTYTVRATDQAGNTGSATTVTFDRTK